MNTLPRLEDIHIRHDLQPGDLGYVVYMHGNLYGREYHYGIPFEMYVATGLSEFYKKYNPEKERAWICEHDNRMIGFLLLMDRGDSAQLRYFIIDPAYRGIGLGKKLMDLYIAFMNQCGYKSSYLLTTHELYAAASLYKRHGFKLVDEQESSLFGKPLREQRYELTLQG
jgi:peptidyl-dipeptidase Dcp